MMHIVEEEKRKRLGKVYVEEQERLNRLENLFSSLSSASDLGIRELFTFLHQREKYVSVPVGLFNTSLSPLEALVLYIYTKFLLSQQQISALLDRDPTTIWTTLHNAQQKISPAQFKAQFGRLAENQLLVPLSVFADRSLSILEHLCIYLREEHEMSNREIARLIGKDDRTIWTVVSRAKKKRKQK